MFTGLIEEIGSVKGVKPSGEGIFLEIAARSVLEGSKIGDSISINGACQTVTEIGRDFFVAFVSKVTASVTTLGSFSPGSPVNLERAMLPVSRFGGHIVQGHVDGTGKVEKLSRDTHGLEVEISLNPGLEKYIVAKGSIAVDGISLTVVSLTEKGFTLYLIPETLDNSIINDWQTGSVVNIEVDILAKYVERMLLAQDGGPAGDEARKDAELKKKLMEEGYF
ncbi:MAG: riboflavin synthase [bacterium]|nr:riboflavin synthase [bacterium]